MPRRDNTSLQSDDTNWRPWSVMMVDGTPKRAIQPRNRAVAHEAAVMSVRGIASTQRENLSMIVNRYEWPSDQVQIEDVKAA